MKRIMSILLAVLLATLLPSASALAAEGEYANMMELFEAWSFEGFPDWVSNVCSRDGYVEHMNVVLVVGQEAREAELRAMLRDSSDLEVITGGKYSYNELLAAQSEIVREGIVGGAYQGVVGCGVGMRADETGLHGFGDTGWECRVGVEVLPEHLEETRTALTECYGDMVYVEEGYPAELVSETAIAEAGKTGEDSRQLFEDIRELNNYWGAFGYPDWVGGTYNSGTSGKLLGVLIVAGQETKEAELRHMLLDDSTLEVTTGCPHSYNEMLAAQMEITAGLGKKTNPPGIQSTAVGWTEDENGVHGYGPSGRELRVHVTIRPKYYETSRAILLDRYGEDMFDFRLGTEPFRNYIAIGAVVLGVVTAAIVIVGKNGNNAPRKGAVSLRSRPETAK